MNKLAKAEVAQIDRPTTEGLERVLIEGDLGGLTQQQRVAYYHRVCESVGLNPLTQPFEYLKLQGKTILYAKRACTDQLRKIHRVSVSICSREKLEGIYVVTARASTPDGRCDESIGAVPVEGLKGEALSNALMKAETKAKRRVTLAICGLSMLDESEVSSVPQAQPVARRTLDDVAAAPAAKPEPVTEYDQATGEVVQGELEPAGEQVGFRDEYGLELPAFSCPRVSSGEHEGKLYTDIPAQLLRAMANSRTFRSSANDAQRAWATYLVARDDAQKASGQ